MTTAEQTQVDLPDSPVEAAIIQDMREVGIMPRREVAAHIAETRGQLLWEPEYPHPAAILAKLRQAVADLAKIVEVGT